MVVGMSGGVDSSVAARLLLDAGYRVIGLFMKNWEEDDGTDYCTAIEDHADAQAIADQLGIPLQTANFAAEYWDGVFEAFLTEYRAGRTPNPDVLCNREIKFKHFVDYAATLGADAVATGHYARVEPIGSERVALHKGCDAAKDQSYFLQAVPLGSFSNCLFPLGTLEKPQVRALAERWGFANHRKKDSTGICFIGERRFKDFLERYVEREPGPMVTTDGKRLGEHHGLAYYTIGQRQGLGIGGHAGAAEAPWYVYGKRRRDNALIVTQQERELLDDNLLASDPNWLAPPEERPERCTAKVRYRQEDQPCTIERLADNQLRVRFDKPQRAATPGQYVCFYDGTRCLGGARIETVGDRLC